ncbi:PDT-domain-containing protein [Coleophoma crateriformis]|uniref:prephenate dehydratase n=1 Tax=Coleophoma crateriformis TaxID=565419 RepID=A0A3D8R7H1_9HELO|nr:PDT-domain-containing protein [Coleophoma crateriformis]
MAATSTSDGVPVVAYLGPQSSYTHQVPTLFHYEIPPWATGLTSHEMAQAALNYFEQSEYNYKPVRSIEAIFEAVQSGEATRGVVPFENSTNGAVIFTLELLADRHAWFKDVSVCGEAYLDVHHYLLGRTAPASATDSPLISGTSTPTPTTPAPLNPRTKPLASLRHVKRIYTHPQAFGQCEAFLGTYLKGVERFEVDSTSRAAEMVAEDTTRSSVAIASSLAAEIHGLDILGESIEDRADNTTRFFVIRKDVETDDDAIHAAATAEGPTKSLVSFTIDHREPGTLASALHCFKRYNLNLTSLNSRPSKLRPFHYIFFVEFWGSRWKDPYKEVDRVLEDLKGHTQSLRWLGSWEDQLRMKEM